MTTTPAPPDLVGSFAVPDPDQPDRLTFWTAGNSRLTPWPEGVRWAPMPPRFHRTDPDRTAKVSQWYEHTYHPWKRRVIEAIDADREAAADRFRRHYADVDIPTPPARSRRAPRAKSARAKGDSLAHRERLEQQLLTAILRRTGRSYGQVAEALDLPKTTAYRRDVQGASGPDHLLVWSLLLVRGGEVERTLWTALTAGGIPAGDVDRVGQWVADLRESCRVLRAALPTAVGTPGD